MSNELGAAEQMIVRGAMSILGSKKSAAKTRAARINAKRPRKKRRKPNEQQP